MRQWRSLTKLADIAESMSTSPLPQVAIPTTPAPTSRGPSNHKQLPETVDNVSRVNTGVPVSSNAGAFEQKSISPPPVSTKVAFGVEDQMAIGNRPLVTELVKSAMAGAASRVRIADEYSRQTKLASEGHEEPDGDEKKDEKKDKKDESAGKEAQATLPSDYALKLAGAVEWIVKKANPVEPGSGPNALHVSQSIDGKPTSQPGGQGQGHAQPPMHPGVQKGLPTEQSPTMLDNTLHSPPGGGGTQTTALTAGHGKTASILYKLAKGNADGGAERFTPEGAGRFTKHQMGKAGLKPPPKELPAGPSSSTKALPAGPSSKGLPGGPSTKALPGHSNRVEFDVTSRPNAPKGRAAASASKGHMPSGGSSSAVQKLKDFASKHRTGLLVGGGVAAAGGAAYAAKKMHDKNASPIDAFRAYVKEAEDAINPAQISAGAAVPPQTSAAGEAGGEPVGGAPQGPSSLIASNEAARNFKRKDAYGTRKGELAAYFSEPALSSQTDKTLEQAFANTANAGTKLGSANMDRMAKTAAARAVIQSLVDDVRATR